MKLVHSQDKPMTEEEREADVFSELVGNYLKLLHSMGFISDVQFIDVPDMQNVAAVTTDLAEFFSGLVAQGPNAQKEVH